MMLVFDIRSEYMVSWLVNIHFGPIGDMRETRTQLLS